MTIPTCSSKTSAPHSASSNSSSVHGVDRILLRMARPVAFGLIGCLIACGAIGAHAQQSAQPPTQPPTTPAPPVLTLNDAFTRALDANRTFAAARAARAIDVAGVGAAGQRANPEASVEYDKETPHWAFAGAFPLDIYNKRQRRIDVANATVAVTDAETARVSAEVRADVRHAYYRAVAATRRVDITQELVGIASRAR